MKHALVKRIGLFMVLGVLAACATPAVPTKTGGQADIVPPSGGSWPVIGDAAGRTGPGGSPLVVDRGIGGTGAPATAPVPRTAERGIGGTGIVGVVTGFGSVFVDGVEIRYDDSAPVDIDGTRSSAAALRAGQLVAIRAEGPATAPYATTISVRSAVSGRIEALELGSGMLTIGGQAVLVPVGTWGANRFGLGDWVTVSGLRRADGTIVASRLDAAPVGVLLIRGRVVVENGVMRVGSVVLPAPMATSVKDGSFVIVSGDYAGGHGRVAAVAPDTMFSNPADYFGSSARRLIVQAFVQVDNGAILMNGVKVNAGSAVSGQAGHDGIAVVSLERGPDGSYTAVDLRYAGYRGHVSQPIRPGTGTRAGDPSRRSGHSTATARTQASGGDNQQAAAEPLATASVTNDQDSGNGPSVPAILPVEVPATLIPDPDLQPAASMQEPPPVAPPVTIAPTVTGTLPAAGTPGTESLSPPNPVVSSNGPTWPGSHSAADRPYHEGARHGRDPSHAETLDGSRSGPTIDRLTTTVTSVTTRNDGWSSGIVSPRSRALVTIAVSKSRKTIGTTSGRSWEGSGGKPHLH
jgi:hypothetical protein